MITFDDKETGDLLTAEEVNDIKDEVNSKVTVGDHIVLPAGTTEAGTSPILFTTGAALTTPEAGSLEFHNDRLYVTNVGTRRSIDRTSDVITETTTITETVVETTLFTGTIGADDLKVGNIIKLHCSGVMANASPSDDLTLNIYIGSDLVLTVDVELGLVTSGTWHADGDITVRTVGSSGTMAYHLDAMIDDHDVEEIGVGSIDTTTSNNIYVKVQWDAAKSGNIFSIYQGYLEFKN